MNKKTDKYNKIRKMLSTSALSVAMISWYTTANGLHQYVFERLWQAYIISAALQGALFTLSINGVSIFFDFNKKIKRYCFVFVWGCLLTASSVFSYVYISKAVYSDELLREDAHRILSTFCLLENYKLNAVADDLLNGSEEKKGIIFSMDEYIDGLAMLDQGVDLSKDDNDNKLLNLKTSLSQYSYMNTNIIGGCVDTSNLVMYIDKIITGKYSNQDIVDANVEAENLIEIIEEKIKSKKEEKETKVKERDDYQERLKTFIYTNNNAYKQLVDLLEVVIYEINKLDSLISDLEIEIGEINRVSNVLDSVENSMESILYNQILEIRKEMNKEDISVDCIQNSSEIIYNILLDNSVKIDKNDFRITDYVQFKNNLRKYSAVVEVKNIINNEIKSLYDMRSIIELISTRNNNVNMEDNPDVNIEEWISCWKGHLNTLKECVRKLSDSGVDEEIIEKLINSMENKERLYLSSLNDFERAWGLLFSDHPYKLLLKFSCIFAFGIDLFSVLISCFLYLFRFKKNN